MPAIRHGQNCDCCAPGAAAQSLDEVSFAKSAAAAAQAGDLFRVKALIARNPAALHDDGYGGEGRWGSFGTRACGVYEWLQACLAVAS